MLQKYSFLNGKLTVSLLVRPRVHEIVERILNSANPLSRLGSILSASGLSYDFYTFVSELTSPRTNYTVYITENSSLGPNTAARTFGYQGRVIIEFNPSYLSTATNLAVARTLTHELIHAYLLVGQAYPQQFGPAFGAVSNYLNNYVSIPYSPENVQHNLMALEYRNTISSMLNNYAYVSNTNVPTSSVEEYTAAMAWAGLQGSVPYTNLPNTERQNIINILTAEQTNAPNNASNKKDC